MPRSIFVSEHGGNIIRLRDLHFGPDDTGLLSFDDLTNASAAIIVTNLSDKLTPRYQVVDTLGNRTILNTFGRSVDTRVVSGICYESSCMAPVSRQSRAPGGYADLTDFFDKHNASVRDTPVIITIGKSLTRHCFLLEMTVSLADSTARVWQFDARMIVEPDRTDRRVAQTLTRTPPGADSLALAGRGDTVQGTRFSGPPLDVAGSGLGIPGFVSRAGDFVNPAPLATPTRVTSFGVANPFVS